MNNEHNADDVRDVYLLWAADTYDASTSLMGVFASRALAEKVGRLLPKKSWGHWHVASCPLETEHFDGTLRSNEGGGSVEA